MRNSEYSSKIPPSLLREVTGLPVRASCDLTRAIGIRKAGHTRGLHPFGEEAGQCVSMGEPLRRLCVRAWTAAVSTEAERGGMTLQCNTQRACSSDASVCEELVQFDSDYSVEDDASFFLFKRSVTHPSPC